MAKKTVKTFSEEFSFYEQLWGFYQDARGKIRSRYRTLTKAFLDYNDRKERPEAYLRPPQFEALEMYVFIKEFMDNKQVIEIFNLWKNKKEDFSERSYYAKDRLGLFDEQVEEQTNILFQQMEKYRQDYPNYIYALTMGLGKSKLMATCIFYEFLLANKYPTDKRYCHNALIFAPDKTVLQTLASEITTFDKTEVIPPEYAYILDANIKIHFLEDTSSSLNTIDNSIFNIIITNNQKIIVRQSHKEKTPIQILFEPNILSSIYDDDTVRDEKLLPPNERFQKLCRLPQIGIYVDEAHHLFGSKLFDDLQSEKTTSFRTTINLLAERLKKHGTQVVACYNYTGTPYVERQVLPEVVYACGLKQAIREEYLKEVDIKSFENVKEKGFLRALIIGYEEINGIKVPGFLDIYKNKTYEGLLPKLAIFTSTVDEIRIVVKPELEKLLTENNIPSSKILVNVGDGNPDLTGNDEIRHFNNLDVPGTEGSQKQFILLCGKGKEGWNCRSLFGVALFRSSFSSVFVLQSTMRCLRQIKIDNEAPKQETAVVYLSKDNYDILDTELNKNFNMSIKDLSNQNKKNKKQYKVTMIPPPQKIKIKEKRYTYEIKEKDKISPIDFKIDSIDIKKYQQIVTEKSRLTKPVNDKKIIVTGIAENITFSEYTMIAEITRYFPEAGALKIDDILEKSKTGKAKILEKVNQYNEILYDWVIPEIFKAFYEITSSSSEIEHLITLLKEPTGENKFYEFIADPALVAYIGEDTYSEYKNKSFHASHYCFDSKPELECFLKFLFSKDVKNVYFTGMFTDKNKTDFSIGYTDPETDHYRSYYPDFWVEMKDGSCQIIEVKGDDKLNDRVVQAKKEAALALTANSETIYRMIAGSLVKRHDIVDPNFDKRNKQFQYPETENGFGMGLAADSGEVKI
jgi:type III restriction enzyme